MNWLLHSYVSGKLSYGAHTLVLSQLQISDKYHSWVAACEAAIGCYLDEIPTQKLSWMEDGLNKLFDSSPQSETFNCNNSSYQADIHDESLRKEISLQNDDLMPPILKSFFSLKNDELPWRKRFPGFSEIKCDKALGDVRLLRIDPGKAMPHHTHEGGVELTLVLKGSFSDGDDEYRRGDICIAGEGDHHQPIAGLEEECICLAVTEGEVRLSGMLGKVLSPFIKY